MKKINFKLILLSLFISVISLPLAEKAFHFSVSKLAELKGAYIKPVCPQLSWKSFFNSELQDSLSTYIESKISNRNALVRLRNQLSFTLFHESENTDLVVGKNNYLFELPYIDSYNSSGGIDSGWIFNQTDMLADIVDTLKSKNIDLLVVFAPSKVSFMPENVPVKYLRMSKHDALYQTCADALLRNSIPFIDFNSYYKSIKTTAEYPVFFKGNAHWSFYTGCEAMDSIARYMQTQFNIPLFSYTLVIPNSTPIPQFQDNDLSSTLNLLNPFADSGFIYPYFVKEDTTKCKRPDVLFVGDSFGWTLIFSQFPQNFFNKNFKFWDYNRTVWSEYYEKARPIENYDYKAELLKNRLIILIDGGLSYNNIGNGFINSAYKIFHPDK